MPPPASTHVGGKSGKKGAAGKEKKGAGNKVRVLISLIFEDMYINWIFYIQAAPKPKQAKPRAKAGGTKAKAKAALEDTSSTPVTASTSSGRGSKASPMTTSTMKKASASASASTAAAAGAARSRSTSAMGGVVPDNIKAENEKDKEHEPAAVEGDGAEGEGKEDDKLYCVCKTRYDEDRVMIACDRCVLFLQFFWTPFFGDIS
jgi:COMPASS component SPP1